MRIVFTSDGIEVPAARYRCMQFFPYFELEGVQCEIIHAYGRLYNRVFDVPVIGAAYKTVTRGARAVRTAAADADLLFLQRTAFPHTAIAERIAHRRGVPMIFDFDDAIFLGPGGVEAPLRARAFRDAVRVSDHCIAGNQYLAEAAGAPEKTTVIPTVIDTDRYVPADATTDQGPIIGWMGTAGNFPFLERTVHSLLKVLTEVPDARVRIVSNATFAPLHGVERVEQIRWSAAREVELLQSFDIGLMPLIDSPLTRGKCAFKMIQYMAVGTPVVVSAVGANLEVLDDRELGFAIEGFDWSDQLITLLHDPDLRAKMGAVGRTRAVESYSVESVVPTYLELFQRFS